MSERLGLIWTLVATGGLLVLWRRLRAAGERAVRAAHEVRGPLTALRLTLERTGGTSLAPAVAAACDLEIRRAALALDELVGVRAGEPVAIDLPALLHCQSESWSALAEAGGVSLGVRCDADVRVVRADAVLLAQATSNLVANAIEHGGGRVLVHAMSAGEGRVRVVVSDGGRGPARVVRRGRGRGGRGRGLAITRQIAARSGGDLLRANSNDGEPGIALELRVPEDIK